MYEEKERENVHADGEGEPESEHGDEEGDSGRSLHLERAFDGHSKTAAHQLSSERVRWEGDVPPEHLGELSVRERQSPKSQVRRRVGDAAEAELDRVCEGSTISSASLKSHRLETYG